jgi:hypothetical protein
LDHIHPHSSTSFNCDEGLLTPQPGISQCRNPQGLVDFQVESVDPKTLDTNVNSAENAVTVLEDHHQFNQDCSSVDADVLEILPLPSRAYCGENSNSGSAVLPDSVDLTELSTSFTDVDLEPTEQCNKSQISWKPFTRSEPSKSVGLLKTNKTSSSSLSSTDEELAFEQDAKKIRQLFNLPFPMIGHDSCDSNNTNMSRDESEVKDIAASPESLSISASESLGDHPKDSHTCTNIEDSIRETEISDTSVASSVKPDLHTSIDKNHGIVDIETPTGTTGRCLTEDRSVKATASSEPDAVDSSSVINSVTKTTVAMERLRKRSGDTKERRKSKDHHSGEGDSDIEVVHRTQEKGNGHHNGQGQ